MRTPLLSLFCSLFFFSSLCAGGGIPRPLIVLDAGHGGKDEGTSVQMLQEKRLTLMCALMVRNHLDKMGYRVMLTRSRDVYLSLPRRVSIANKNQCAAFVSIHFNAASNVSAHGIEVFYCSTRAPNRARQSQRLADCILYNLIDETEARSRGVKKGNHHVTREAEMPAVLVEGGFLTNREERLLLKQRSYVDKIALGIAKGVDKFLKGTPAKKRSVANRL